MPLLSVADEYAEELSESVGRVLERGEYGVPVLGLECDEPAPAIECGGDSCGGCDCVRAAVSDERGDECACVVHCDRDAVEAEHAAEDTQEAA
jgi:hypothetical protein